MLLTLTTTYQPATDLGFLLHKHPDKARQFGRAHMFYPEASPERCTAALLLDIAVRGGPGTVTERRRRVGNGGRPQPPGFGDEREKSTPAREYYGESLGMYRTLDDKGGTAIVLNNVGELARCQGDFRGTSEFYEASLALPADTGNIRRRALILGNLGFVTLHLGGAKRAEALLLESLTLKYELQDEIGLSYCFAGLAGVSCELEKFERAAVLLGVADTLLECTKHQLDLADRHDAERALAAARARPALDVFSAAWKRGKGMILEQAARYALGHEYTRALACQHLS